MLIVGLTQACIIAIFGFSQTTFPNAWIWLLFGVFYWICLTVIICGPVMARAIVLPKKALNLYVIAGSSLLLMQIFYPVVVLLLVLEKISAFVFFLIIGIMIILTRSMIGILFAFHLDAFGDLKFVITRNDCRIEEEESLITTQTEP